MAIGNAPWPIGVTNAGIHARPGRERIFSKHVAHVLNDEFQRKYIQVLINIFVVLYYRQLSLWDNKIGIKPICLMKSYYKTIRNQTFFFLIGTQGNKLGISVSF